MLGILFQKIGETFLEISEKAAGFRSLIFIITAAVVIAVFYFIFIYDSKKSSKAQKATAADVKGKTATGAVTKDDTAIGVKQSTSKSSKAEPLSKSNKKLKKTDKKSKAQKSHKRSPKEAVISALVVDRKEYENYVAENHKTEQETEIESTNSKVVECSDSEDVQDTINSNEIKEYTEVSNKDKDLETADPNYNSKEDVGTQSSEDKDETNAANSEQRNLEEVSEERADTDEEENNSLEEMTQEDAEYHDSDIVDENDNNTNSLQILYDDDNCESLIFDDDNNTELKIHKVMVNGSVCMFDDSYEIRFREGDKVYIDFGVQFVIPDGWSITTSINSDMLSKHGLSLVADPIELGKGHNVSIRCVAVSDLSYIGKNTKLLSVKLKGGCLV